MVSDSDCVLLSPRTAQCIVSKEGNSRCNDCGEAHPEWGSVSFGVLVCSRCAGKHRHLGVHITKVRSVLMDAWNENEVSMMLAGGNASFSCFRMKINQRESSFLERYKSPSSDWYRMSLLSIVRGGSVGGLDISDGALKALCTADFQWEQNSMTKTSLRSTVVRTQPKVTGVTKVVRKSKGDHTEQWYCDLLPCIGLFAIVSLGQ